MIIFQSHCDYCLNRFPEYGETDYSFKGKSRVDMRINETIEVFIVQNEIKGSKLQAINIKRTEHLYSILHRKICHSIFYNRNNDVMTYGFATVKEATRATKQRRQ